MTKFFWLKICLYAKTQNRRDAYITENMRENVLAVTDNISMCADRKILL